MLSRCHKALLSGVAHEPPQMNSLCYHANQAPDRSWSYTKWFQFPPDSNRLYLFESYLVPLVHTSNTLFSWNVWSLLFQNWKNKKQKEYTKGIRNKLYFCGRFVWAQMGDGVLSWKDLRKAIRERLQYFIILTWTSVLSLGTGGSQGVPCLFRHLSHNELYYLPSGR